MIKTLIWRPLRRVADFMSGSATGGLVLMGTAVLAIIVANSPLAPNYFAGLHAEIGPLSVLHWVNDGLMAVFFLLVGLEIKREFIDGELASNSLRILPGLSALGGMVVPALLYLLVNRGDAESLRGWAIPSATDIAFALGVAALLGSRVPASLKAFLAALAIIDDLGAVIIIALFYTPDIQVLFLGLSVLSVLFMAAMNRLGVRRLWPYLLSGCVLWVFVHASGVHATLAGVATALCVPLSDAQGRLPSDGDCTHSPLLRLEHALHRLVPMTVLPLFGFANAGISFSGVGAEQWLAATTVGVGLGLALGKLVGVFGTSWLAIRLGWAAMPGRASMSQLFGTALLCGIGFTMSLFIGMLAFPAHPELQDEVKLGILIGSVLAGLAGWTVLRLAARPAVASST
ncbi:MAG: Na+/H+ antiporter NhaA [Luteibacter sp.]